jgi:sugar lactone lactonase YvrE
MNFVDRTVTVATEQPCFLAEGPTWDPVRHRLLWVDITAGAVHSGRLEIDGTITQDARLDVPGTAGAVAVAETGDLLIAGTNQLHTWVPDEGLSTGEQMIEGDERRFNDGKPDPAGRFVVGTKGPSAHEQLLRVEHDGSVTVIDDNLTLSNGLGWTADGRRMYSIDTGTGRIFVRDYDTATGEVGAREVFATITEGHPDGMTMDADDHLWVAVWGEGCVLRFSPDGDIVDRIDVPAPHTSCPAFIGDDLRTLVITTAREGLDDRQLADHPFSGRLFTVTPGVTGAAPHLWAGNLDSHRKDQP